MCVMKKIIYSPTLTAPLRMDKQFHPTFYIMTVILTNDISKGGY